jgi:hypothetical protein
MILAAAGYVVYFFVAPRFDLPAPPRFTIPLALFAPVLYMIALKRLAKRSLEELLEARFRRLADRPVDRLPVPRGGEFVCLRARSGDEPFVVLLGTWQRGTVMAGGAPRDAHIDVAGVYLVPSPGESWLRAQGDALIAVMHGAGAIVVWPELASGETLRARLDALPKKLSDRR